MDDLFRQRYRRDERRIILPGESVGDTPAILVKVFQQTTIPTTAGVFYACHPTTVFGTETEGSGGTLATDTSQTIFVLVVGKAASVGDYLIARFVANRWVAEGAGVSGGVVITARNCLLTGFPGLPVTVKQSGTTVASGTTDGSGKFTCSLAASTAYTFTIVGPAPRNGTLSGSFTTDSSGVANSGGLIPAATGYICTIVCSFPIKKAWVYSSTNGGTGTGTWLSGNQWSVQATEPATVLDGTVFCNGISGNSTVRFNVNIVAGPSASFANWAWVMGSEAGSGFPYYSQPGTLGLSGGGTGLCAVFIASANTTASTSFACLAFMTQGTLPTSNNNGPPTVSPPGSGATFTITEAP